MPFQRLAPDASVGWTGLNSANDVTYIQDDPYAPDALWYTRNASGATSLRVSFPTPAAAPADHAAMAVSVLANRSGANVECLVRQTQGSGGQASVRRYVEVGAIDWYAWSEATSRRRVCVMG